VRAWTSADGVAWVSETIDAAPTGDLTLSGVCALPGGGAVLVGSVERSGTRTALRWVRSDGTWKLGAPVSDQPSSALTGCVSGTANTLVSGSVNGRDVLWSTTDGGSFHELRRAAAGESFDLPVAIDGGWASWGTENTPGHTGPVVWIASRADTWTPLPLPMSDPRLTGVPSPDGSDVVVVASGVGGWTGWRLSGVVDTLAAS
jgi:hypothetical protein